MSAGVITGGWEFVWAGYALSFAVYTLYAVWAVRRWKHEHRRAEGYAHRTDGPTPRRGGGYRAERREGCDESD